MSRDAAVLLDKDGTLVEDVPYNVDPRRIRLAPGAGVGLRLLQAAGYKLIVVSNQSGVARGLFTMDELGRAEDALRDRLRLRGVRLDDVYACPHHPAGTVPGYSRDCACRKPRAGLLRRAAREHGLDLESSWMVGDILDAVEAGRRAGCRTVLLDRGGETVWHLTPLRTPHVVARDLLDAARAILQTGQERARRHGRPATSTRSV